MDEKATQLYQLLITLTLTTVPIVDSGWEGKTALPTLNNTHTYYCTHRGYSGWKGNTALPTLNNTHTYYCTHRGWWMRRQHSLTNSCIFFRIYLYIAPSFSLYKNLLAWSPDCKTCSCRVYWGWQCTEYCPNRWYSYIPSRICTVLKKVECY